MSTASELPQVSSYRGEGIVVTFDGKLCQHSAECARGLPDVFDTRQRPWVTPDNAKPAEVAAVIARCPSGALQYTFAE
ncbi:MAG: (4Fe-4S)-binding protein [Thermoleophilaceae bacterium]|nr:(4Fe-4S)-binding protein [Thermoleophilaceae bacterium]